MALKKFETETETNAVETTTGETEMTNTATPVTDAAVAATTAIAKAATTSVAISRAFAPALQEMENVISPSDVADLGPGAFPKITVDLGGFLMDKKDIGTVIKVELISWNKRWVVSAGVQDAEANELVKFSMDGITLQGDNRTLKEYITFLRDVEGYKNAGVKEYYSMWCNLTHCSGADVPVNDQKMVEIQLSPQSVGQFKAFQIEYGMKVSKGVVPATNALLLHAEKKEIKTTRFGIVRFSAIQ
jgi:hypothetical protein